MKILYLAHRIPYPPNKGDKIRSFHQIKLLSETCQIDLVCLVDDPGDFNYVPDLEKYCRTVKAFPLNRKVAKVKGGLNLLAGGTISVAYFHRPDAQRAVDELLANNHYDAIVCFSSVMAEYVFRAKDHIKQAKLIMDFCDVDSDKWRQYASEASPLLRAIYQTEFRRLLAYEQKVNQAFAGSVFVTQQEADLFKSLYPAAKNLHVVRNGVDHQFFNASADFPKLEKSYPTLVFTGAMDYHANVDAVTWFCREIWPGVKKSVPDCQFYIVGSKPTPAVQNLATLKDVVVTGFVDDIRSYYDIADVCVTPLRLARGVQNKVLEAMAMGKAVVTTTKAANGVGASASQHLLVADNSTDFAASVLSLLGNSTDKEQLGKRAADFVQNEFDWAKNIALLKTLIS